MKKPMDVEVVDEGDERYVIATHTDGSVVRTLVDFTKKPTRKPRKPFVRVGLERMNKTRRKRY